MRSLLHRRDAMPVIAMLIQIVSVPGTASATPAATTPPIQQSAPVFDAPAWLTNDPGRARNRLSYRAGGIMTAPLTFDIDLDSGRFAFESRPLNPRPGEGVQRDGVVDSPTLLRIRRLAVAAMADWMDTQRCKRTPSGIATSPPVLADSMVDFHVLLDGRYGGASGRDCPSKASSDLYDAAFAAVSPPQPEAKDHRP